MTREKLTARICDLHAEVKAAGVGVELIGREQLDAHLAKQPEHTLRSIRRFYEGLLEGYRASVGREQKATRR
jgi:hypothetical protein